MFPGFAPDLGDRPPEALPDKHALFRALFDLLVTPASGGPLAVVIEDLHWADEASLEFILHFARHIVARSVLFVLTDRDDEVGESLAHLLAELDRGRLATELNLDRLTRDETEEMISEGEPGVDVDVRLQVAIPRSVRESVRRRTAALTPRARHLAQLAAVAGRHFDFALLHALVGLDEATVIALVKELVGAQLIVEESGDRFRFRHALTREAIYSELLARERQALHEVIGQAFEEVYGENVTAHAGDVGYHYFEARRFAKTLEYCRLAGESAERMWAPRAAVEHYSRALTAARELRQAASVALLRARGRAYEAIGDFDRALGDQQLALATARLNGQRQAEWQALIDLGMLWASRDYERTGEYYEQAFTLAQELGDQTLLAHSLNRVGNWCVNRELPVEGLEKHKQALALFEALGDQHGIAATLDLLGMACFMGCDLVQGIGYYRRAAALLRELDDRMGLASCLAAMTLYGRSNLQQDTSVPCDLTPAEALEYSEEARRLGTEIGWRSIESFALWTRAVLFAAQGHYRAAIDAASRGLTIAEEIAHDQWITGACHALGSTYIELFCFNIAEGYLQRMKELADRTRSRNWILHAYSCLAFTRAARGDCASGEALMRKILTPDTPARGIGERMAWTMAAELALYEKDYERGAAIVARLKADAPNLNRGPKGVRLSLLEGVSLAGMGRYDAAEDVLRDGCENAAIEGSRGRLWRLEAALAHLYRALGRETEADAACDRARRVVAGLLPEVPETLQARFLAGARAVLPALGSLARSNGRLGGPGVLTNREWSIAGLIAQGLTNRAIADALVVSERTIETHVSSILAELGFTSRAQIAAWATERGIRDGDLRGR